MQNKNKKWFIIRWCLIGFGVFFLINTAWTAGHRAYTWLFVWDFASPEVVLSHPIEPDRVLLDALDNTPMAEAKPYILKASRYYQLPISLYLGIANAESSFTHFSAYNPWGIKPNGQLKAYASWEQSVNGFSQLLKYYYWEQGLKTAEQLEMKYVGYASPDWVTNVSAFHR